MRHSLEMRQEEGNLNLGFIVYWRRFMACPTLVYLSWFFSVLKDIKKTSFRFIRLPVDCGSCPCG